MNYLYVCHHLLIIQAYRVWIKCWNSRSSSWVLPQLPVWVLGAFDSIESSTSYHILALSPLRTRERNVCLVKVLDASFLHILGTHNVYVRRVTCVSNSQHHGYITIALLLYT
jgi:hypothetical protein